MQSQRLYVHRNGVAAARTLRIYCLLLGVLVLAACQSTHEPDVSSGDSAPRFDATTVDGRSFTFPDDFAEGPTIVLMWATWCPYCKVLMPRLSEISADYRHHGLDIIAINAKERGHGDPANYVKEAGFDFWTVADGDLIAEQFDVEYLPGVFVVSGSGQIEYRRGWTELPAGQSVADLWEEELRTTLESMAGARASANSVRSIETAD